VDDILDELKDANIYTHLNSVSSLWQFRVRDEDMDKTMLETRDGLMEWVSMPLGLYNALTTFQRMLNDILREFYTSLLPFATSTTTMSTIERLKSTWSAHVLSNNVLMRRRA
jgi:hypothetical protein